MRVTTREGSKARGSGGHHSAELKQLGSKAEGAKRSSHGNELHVFWPAGKQLKGASKWIRLSAEKPKAYFP